MKPSDNELPLTVLQARKCGAAQLALSGLPENCIEADLLLSHVLGTERSILLAHRDRVMTSEEAAVFQTLLERRKHREPMAYITGEAAFRNFIFSVGPGCLVPRPETELLVDRALSLAGWRTLLDWGTGSGCISLCLLLERPDASAAFAVDASAAALRWAWENVRAFDLHDRCRLWHGASFDTIPKDVLPVDLLVSNPPYIPTYRLADLPEDVLKEPVTALDGGKDGLDIARHILENAPRVVRSGGFVLMETGDDEQAKDLSSFKTPGLVFCETIRDFNGISRIVLWGRV